MDRFPLLKSGAVVQYGSAYSQQYRTDILTYVDGREQRVPTRRTPTLTWCVRLQKLSAAEAMGILDFYYLQRGRAGTFVFSDPWTGRDHVCCFDGDTASATYRGENSLQAELIIREITT